MFLSGGPIKEEKFTADDLFVKPFGYRYGKRISEAGAKVDLYAVRKDKDSKMAIINKYGHKLVSNAKVFYSENGVCSVLTEDLGYVFISTENGKTFAESSKGAISVERKDKDMDSLKKFALQRKGCDDKIDAFLRLTDEMLLDDEVRENALMVIQRILTYYSDHYNKPMRRYFPSKRKAFFNASFKTQEECEAHIAEIVAVIKNRLEKVNALDCVK